MEEGTKQRKIKKWVLVAIFLVIYDFITINFSYFFGLWIRFDFAFRSIPENYLGAFVRFTPFYALGAILFFWFLRLYRSIWRFVGVYELIRYMLASLAASLMHSVLITLIFERMPFAYYVVGAVLQLIFVVGIRLSYRLYLVLAQNRDHTVVKSTVRRVMIIGAGAAGRSIIRELLHTDKLNAFPCCIIDDNVNKWSRFIDGVPVAGGRNEIPYNVRKYEIDDIYFCIPTASAKDRKEILDICKETGCTLKSLPGTYQLITGEVLTGNLRPVAVEELLGREPVKVNMDEIFHLLGGKTILVTGGGGSIGSELCRQIAAHGPKELVIFDIYENNAYDIEQELKGTYPDLALDVVIGSVRDMGKVLEVFETYRPQIVYHAAAHKHVPLMEFSPCEAIKNNVMGTYKTALAAMKYGCKRFVLISTDKAVNPTNVMGASKRLCEILVQSLNRISKTGNYGLLAPMSLEPLLEKTLGEIEEGGTEFVAVRFGNVLGSNGSVIPLFKRQIAEGGPVTVTHKDITRYFMTIPEAVNLVLQAGTYAKGGEIFVLDMGEPIKIDNLARNLIKLSGLKPEEDIEIRYVGLRPGEKLYEEKLMEEEGLRTTPNKLIHIGSPLDIDVEEFMKKLGKLVKLANENAKDIKEAVRELVPNYRPEIKEKE